MSIITDEFMQKSLLNTKNYSIVILKAGPNKNMDGAGILLFVKMEFYQSYARFLTAAILAVSEFSILTSGIQKQ